MYKFEYNISRNHQSNKIEKENENVKLRKKIKTLSSTDKPLTAKKETVWDRLSKLKKVSSRNNGLAVARSRSNLADKAFQRLQPKNSFKQQFVKSGPKPLPVGKIVSARSLNEDSKSPSNDKVDFGSGYSSEDSNEQYISAPLLTSDSEDDSKNCARALNNVGDILQRNKESMVYEDIELVKYFTKSASSSVSLEKTTDPVKGILKAQLQNIFTHEFVAKKASNRLVSPASLEQCLEIKSPTPINKIMSNSVRNKASHKLEVDVIFTNIPSLDKEIEVLKALGEKLEATLKSTSSHVTRRDAVTQISIMPNTKQLLKTEKKKSQIILNVKYEVHDLTLEYYAKASAQLIGFRYCVGEVKEFLMAQKSIVELKRESNRLFYMPSHSENVQLVETSFNELKQYPNEFLRHVKPKGSQVTFNILEQDSVFFHGIFNHMPTNCIQYKGHQIHPSTQTPCESGVSHNDEIFLTKKDESKNMNLFPIALRSDSDTENILFNGSPILDSVIVGKQRIRKKRRVTPMPISNLYCPKNSLFKTILVGFVQMFVFVVLIMALTYPDVRC